MWYSEARMLIAATKLRLGDLNSSQFVVKELEGYLRRAKGADGYVGGDLLGRNPDILCIAVGWIEKEAAARFHRLTAQRKTLRRLQNFSPREIQAVTFESMVFPPWIEIETRLSAETQVASSPERR